MPIKLFVRVKERIKPDQCTHTVTSKSIKITLVKEYESSMRWNRLEPNEHSEFHPLQPTSPLSTYPSSTANLHSTMNNLNRGEIYSKFN